MLEDLRAHYRRHGIGAFGFSCRHSPACRSAGGQFTEAKESFVGTEYEKGTLPRLLFLSLDSGSGNPDPHRRTLEFTRTSIEAADVLAFPKGRHWYVTHEMCWVLLRQFKPGLTIATTPPYFAHVNSAKCCQNNQGRSVASDVLFDNCREFIPDEIRILRPDIIVTQGGQARRVMEVGFSVIRGMAIGSCRAQVVRCGDGEALWIHTHHPSAYAPFWPQRRECWAAFASMVGTFIAGASAGTEEASIRRLPAVRLLKMSVKQPKGAPEPAKSTVRPQASATLPTTIDELIDAARSIASPGSFNEFMRRMRALPGAARQHVGVFTGMRVQQFQNWQLDENPKLRLTDAQILAVMRVEFPLNQGTVFTGTIEEGLRIVQGIRAHYNRDGHNGPSPRERGMPPSVSYGRV